MRILSLNIDQRQFTGYLSLILLAGMWVFPFFFGKQLPPMISYHGEWLALMLGLLAILAWLPFLFMEKNRLPRVALLPLSILAFLVVQQWLLPQVNIQRLPYGASYLLWAASIMILAHNLQRHIEFKEMARVLALALMLGAVFASGREFWCRYILDTGGDWGGFRQANRYSAYLCLGLVSSLYLRIGERFAGSWCLLLLALSELVIVAGMSVSSSRSIWIYITLLALLTVGSKIPEKIRLLIGLVGVVFVLVALQSIWKMGWLPMIETEKLSGDRLFQGGDSIGIRLRLWQVALQIFMDSPWLGQGFGQSSWAFFKAGNIPGCPNCVVEHTHNIIMQFLVELGLFPLLALLGGLGIWLIAFVKSKILVEGWWLLGLLTIIGWYSMVEYPLWFSYFLGIVAVLLGMGEQKGYEVHLNKIGKWGAVLTLPVLIGLCISHRNDYIRMENMKYALEHNTKNMSNEEYVENIGSVGQSSPSLAPYVRVELMLNSKGYSQPSDRLLETGDLAMRFWPKPMVVYRQSIYLALAGRIEESVALMSQNLKTYPFSTDYFFQDLQAFSLPERQKLAFLIEMAKNNVSVTK